MGWRLWWQMEQKYPGNVLCDMMEHSVLFHVGDIWTAGGEDGGDHLEFSWPLIRLCFWRWIRDGEGVCDVLCSIRMHGLCTRSKLRKLVHWLSSSYNTRQGFFRRCLRCWGCGGGTVFCYIFFICSSMSVLHLRSYCMKQPRYLYTEQPATLVPLIISSFLSIGLFLLKSCTISFVFVTLSSRWFSLHHWRT